MSAEGPPNLDQTPGRSSFRRSAAVRCRAVFFAVSFLVAFGASRLAPDSSRKFNPRGIVSVRSFSARTAPKGSRHCDGGLRWSYVPVPATARPFRFELSVQWRFRVKLLTDSPDEPSSQERRLRSRQASLLPQPQVFAVMALVTHWVKCAAVANPDGSQTYRKR